MCNESTKPVLQINFDSPEDNIFFICQKAADLLRLRFSIDQTKRIEEMVARVENASNYTESHSLLSVIMS